MRKCVYLALYFIYANKIYFKFINFRPDSKTEASTKPREIL